MSTKRSKKHSPIKYNGEPFIPQDSAVSRLRGAAPLIKYMTEDFIQNYIMPYSYMNLQELLEEYESWTFGRTMRKHQIAKMIILFGHDCPPYVKPSKETGEEEEDVNYHEINKKDLYCEVCGKGFLRVKQFIFHHRRHSSIDHYQCPTCLRGFTTLTACQAHEVHQHQNKSAGGKSSAIREDSSDEEDESTANRILPSNSYQLYRGPPVSDLLQCHDIEDKYGDRYPPQTSS